MTSKVITTFVDPPIPLRDFDWQAYEPGYEPGDALGHGATEQAAIDDLLDQLD